MNDLITNIVKRREFYLFLVILAMAVILSILSSGFLSYNNFYAIASNESMKGIVVIGITLLLITRNFDLSVASVMALSGVITAYLLSRGINIPISILGGLVSGIIAGFINGLLVTKLRINSFIATLGMMYMARGMALVVTKGAPIYDFPENFKIIGQIYFLGIPLYLFILILILVVVGFLIKNQLFFVKLFYIGNNDEAADYVGIDSRRSKWIIFILSGLLASLAGVLLTAKMTSAIPTSFEGLELKFIAASIIGGASLKGGKGSVIGAILGFIVIILIGNAMSILSISVYFEGVIMGTVLILAAIYDAVSQSNEN